MTRDEPREAPLNGWKEIASFFGKDQRTAKRWEATRGLPIHRVPGGNRASVFAYPSELEEWLRQGKDADEVATADDPVSEGSPDAESPTESVERPPAATSTLRSRRVLFLGLAVAALLLATPWAYRWWFDALHPPAVGEVLSQDLTAREAYLAANYELSLRTPAGLRDAAQLYGVAIARDPQFAAAHAGLAKAYALLAEYKVLPAAEAYPAARASARAALELDPRHAGAYAALGLIAFHADRDFAASRRLLERALALDPQSAETLHWLARTTVLTGDFNQAMAWITKAQELDADSRAIVSSKGQILYRAGELKSAARLLAQFATTAPEYAVPHFYLADIYLEQGRYDDAIRRGIEAARLSEDSALQRVYEAAHAGYHREGGKGMLEGMLAAQIELCRAGKVAAYRVARTLAKLDRREEAMAYLEQAVASNEPETVAMKVDPAFIRLRDDARFATLLVKVGHSPDFTGGSFASVDGSVTSATEVHR